MCAGDVQVPCGYDSLSYSWRDLNGTLFHKSKGTEYPDGAYGIGDVLGFLIVLPAEPSCASLPIRPPEAVVRGCVCVCVCWGSEVCLAAAVHVPVGCALG